MPPNSAWLRRGIALALGLLALVGGFPSALRAQEPMVYPPTPAASQRMAAVGQLGGMVSAVAPEPDNATLAGEGGSLVRLQGSRVVARADLGHGAIQDIEGIPPNRYVLTERGLIIMQGAWGALPQEVAFVPGGGQALAVYNDAVALIAAREAGLRLVSIPEARELAVIPLPGAAVDVTITPDGQTAYVAAGESGVHQVDLTALTLTTTFPIQPAQTVRLADSLLVVGSGDSVLRVDPSTGAVVDHYAPMRAGRRIALSGQYAYVADPESGLKIFLITHYESIVQVYGEAGREAYDIVVSDRYAFIAAGAEGVRVFDMLRPYDPVELVTVPLPGPAEGLTLSEGRLFVAMGEAGLAVLNAVSPAGTNLVNTIPLEGPAHAVIAQEGFAYVATGEAGLSIVNITEPGREWLLSTVPLAGDAVDVARRRDIILVAAGEAGLHAVDVVRISQPTLRDTLPPCEGCPGFRSVVATDKRAFVADGEGFVVIDLAETDRMSSLARESFPTEGLTLADINVLAVGGRQMAIYDARASAEPAHVVTYHAPEAITDVAIRDGRYYLANGGDGPEMVVLDYPREAALYGAEGRTLRVQPVDGGALAAAGYRGAFRLRQEEDPTRAGGLALTLESAYSPFAEINRLRLAGGGQMLAGGDDGLAVVDVTSAALPQGLTRTGEGLRVEDAALDGDRLAVAAYQDGVALFLYGSPWMPEQLAQATTDGPAMGVDIDANYVYAADASGAFRILSRYGLSPVMQITLPAGANGLTRSGSLAYIPLDDGSVAVVDLTDPSGGVRRLGAFPINRPTALIPAPAADRVFGITDNALTLFDISDPAGITGEAVYSMGEAAASGALDGMQLYAVVPGVGAQVYEATRPDRPYPLGWLSAAGEDILPNGSAAYVAYGAGGLGVIANTTQADNPPTMLLGEPVYAMTLAGGRLIATGDALTVWNLSQPGAPTLLGRVDLPAPAQALAPAGSGYIVAGAGNALVVVIVDAAGQPTLAGQMTTASAVTHVAVLGSHAYAGLHDGGLLVVDLTTPTAPTPLFTITSAMGRYVQSLLALDATRLMVSWEAGLEILDVGALAASPPRVVTVTPTGGAEALDVAVGNGMAAVALGEDGAALLNLSSPSQPSIMGRADTPGSGEQVALSGSALFVADGVCGVRAFTLQDPTAPAETGFWVNGYAGDVTTDSAGQVYVADANELYILAFRPDDPAALPPIPQMPSPADWEDGVAIAPVLRWGSPADPCDPLAYDVYFGAGDNPPFMGRVGGEPMLALTPLDPLQTYYWRVEATDRQGDRVSGPTWHFTTGEGGPEDNPPPAPPPFEETTRPSFVIVLLIILAVILLIALLALRQSRRRKKAEMDEP